MCWLCVEKRGRERMKKKKKKRLKKHGRGQGRKRGIKAPQRVDLAGGDKTTVTLLFYCVLSTGMTYSKCGHRQERETPPKTA